MSVRDRQLLQRPRSTSRRRRLGALLIGLILCASPGIARAQNPFAPLPTQPSSTPTATTPAPTTSATSAGSGLSSTEQIGLVGAGIVVIAGIAFLIRRDAHARAPVTTRASASGQRGTAQPKAKRVEQSRAKAKAARRQRKRNR